MNLPLLARGNERGFVLIVTLIILLLLVVLGISATTTSMLETQIAGTEKAYKSSFYEADGGAEVAAMLIEENLSCPTGFTANDGSDRLLTGGSIRVLGTAPRSLAFWQNALPTNTNVSDSNRDIVYDPDANAATTPHTNLLIGGQTFMAPGGSIQQAAGYEGKGKGIAGGGGYVLYDVYSQHKGQLNTDSIIYMQWRHAIGQEGSCNNGTL